MVKVISPEQAASNDGTNKQRKKQAKREAKTMLKLEQAKKDVQKAEQKAAKAQAQLEADRTHLRMLEEELQKLRSPRRKKAGKAQTADEESAASAPEVMPQASSDETQASSAQEQPADGEDA